MSTAKSKSLDQADLDILAMLQKDARTTNKDIAKQIGIAPSTCLERIKKLQREGIIQGTHIRVNQEALGQHIQAMISIRIDAQDRATMESFRNTLLNKSEVISIFHMGGENDFLVHTSVANATHLRDFVFDAITSHTLVNHVETALIYEHSYSLSLHN